MKRYLLFVGEPFYPRGGWHDFRGDFDSVDDGVATGRELKDSPDFIAGRWWHVVDTDTGKIVAGTFYQSLTSDSLPDGEKDADGS